MIPPSVFVAVSGNFLLFWRSFENVKFFLTESEGDIFVCIILVTDGSEDRLSVLMLVAQSKTHIQLVIQKWNVANRTIWYLVHLSLIQKYSLAFDISFSTLHAEEFAVL
jgi:hypothetical protein